MFAPFHYFKGGVVRNSEAYVRSWCHVKCWSNRKGKPDLAAQQGKPAHSIHHVNLKAWKRGQRRVHTAMDILCRRCCIPQKQLQCLQVSCSNFNIIIRIIRVSGYLAMGYTRVGVLSYTAIALSSNEFRFIRVLQERVDLQMECNGFRLNGVICYICVPALLLLGVFLL